MKARSRLLALPAAAAAACLAFAATASAGTTAISGTVANGSCDANRTVAVTSASRIEVTVASTAQNNTNFYAEILSPDGKVVGAGSYVAYDTPGAGSYAVRVCAVYEAQSPPNLQYSGQLATGPAGQQILTEPAQPQAGTGGVLGVSKTISYAIKGKVAIHTRAGLAWFTLGTASNGTTTLHVVNPAHRNKTLVVKGLMTTQSGKTVRITGHGLKLVLTGTRASYSSSSFNASGKIVRGKYQITA